MNLLFRSAFSLLALIAALGFWVATPVHAQVSTWIGGSGVDSNWSTSANWQGGATPDGNTDMTFTGSLRTTNNNDFSNNQISLNFLDFASGAAAFTLQGSPVQITHPAGTNTITNDSTNLQTLDFNAAMNVQVQLTINASSGDIRINNGLSLQAFQSNSADLTVTGSHNTTIAGVIDDSLINPAAVIKTGTGTLLLTSNNTFRDFIRIDNGVVAVQAYHALGQGSTVLNNGTLEVNGGLPAFFAVGDGSQPISDYFQNGGILRLQVGGLTPGLTADQIQIFGAAHLGGELFIHQVFGFMPTPGDRVTILATLAGVNSTFATVASDFPGLLQPVADYSFANRVDIVFTLGSFVLNGLTPNQRAVAGELNEVANDPREAALIAFLGGQQPLGALPHDYDLIAPEELASIYEIGFSQAVVHNNNLMRRMDDIRAGSNGYSGPVVEVPSSKDAPIQDKNVAIPDKNVAPAFVPCPENRWGVFVTGSGDFVTVGDDDFNAHGYDIATGDITVGVDYRVGKNFAIGLDGGYSGSTADLVDNGRVDVDGGKIGGYATVFGKGFFGSRIHVDGAVDGGWNSYDTRRTGLQNIPVRGSTDGSEFNALLAYGADWTFGCFNIGTWSTLQYTDVNIDGFTETGSLAPLEIQDQDEYSFRGTTGMRGSYDFHFGRCGIFRPEIRAAWQHESNDSAYPIDARFASGAGDVFTVHGPKIGRDAALVGAGLNVQWCARFTTYVYYDGVLGRDNYDNNAVSGGFRLGF